MSASDHFSGVAGAYALQRPGYPDELFAFLNQLARKHDLAWDCAAGSGQASVPLARYFRRVVATDLSAAMLGQAAHSSVEYRVAPAQASGLDEGSVDLVTVAQALHWLDLEAFYAEVDRVLRPGGVLAAWTYGNQVLDDPALDGVLRAFYRDTVGPFWPSERSHVEAGYRTLRFPYPELQTPAFQMEKQWTLADLLGYVRTWSATQRFRDARGYDPVIDLGLELQGRWGQPGSYRRVAWPLSIRAGRRPD